KRMAFIGEGIAHAGFGGLGTALFLGLTGGGLGSGGTWKSDLVVLAFCLATAFAIGMLSRRRHVEADSAIGILLVAAMAWGVLLTDLHRNVQGDDWYIRLFGPPRQPVNIESLLFGSLSNVGPYDVWLALGVAAVVLGLLATFFKEIIFYAFEETVSQMFGVRTQLIHYLILALLSVTIVLTVRLAGIVLVTALLVIPGATATLLSRRLAGVLIWSWWVGMIGIVGGLILSLEAGNLSTGPCVVAVLCVQFALALIVRSPLNRR
ncbi:MAG TPA: metal ABC transporter permease, partial [Pirellulales bacterium]|nr:metal ABC transporter permease [Pirellulales bacterium]